MGECVSAFLPKYSYLCNMKVSELYQKFPDDSTCRQILKIIRENEGVICKKCGGDEYYWKNDKECFECKRCKFRTSLRNGTIMENSNLPIKYWLLALIIYEKSKGGITAIDLQKGFGHKRYEPIWLMWKKINSASQRTRLIQALSKYIKIEEVSLEED